MHSELVVLPVVASGPLESEPLHEQLLTFLT